MKILSYTLLFTLSIPTFANTPCHEYDPLCGLDGETLDLSTDEQISTTEEAIESESESESEQQEEEAQQPTEEEESPAVTTEVDTEVDEEIISFTGILGATKQPVKEIKPEKKPCRAAVVDGKKVLGKNLDPQSFSTKTFADLGVSADEFNALPIEDQKKLYMQIMPMSVMVEITITELNTSINDYSGSFFELVFADMLMSMRAARDNLKICIFE